MRFTKNGFDLLRILRFNSQRLLRMLAMPLTNLYRRVRRVLNPNGFSTKVIGDIRKGFHKSISAKPSSFKDYFALSRYYVAKSLVFIVLLALILLPVAYLKFVHPLILAQFFTKTMEVNAAEMNGYTGKVRLLFPGTENVIYRGSLSEGRVTGQGILYDGETGALVYQGGFLLEMYDGEGQVFYPNGQTQYKGSFVKNNYEGTGFLYRGDGTLQYEGGFLKGFYEGVGKEYYSNGVLRYEGDFSKNQYQGSGVLYDGSGQMVYKGEFKNGKYEGQGSLYENGAILYQGQLAAGELNGQGKVFSGELVLYEGSFKDNRYNGPGMAYDPVTEHLIYDGEYANGKYSGAGRLFDPQTGNLLYEGDFYDNNYAGEGKLFDSDTGFPVYQGGFRLGRFDGQGTLYDFTTGGIFYEGGFLLDNYNGKGTMYNIATGEILAQGIFQGGHLLLAAETEAGLNGQPVEEPGPGAGGENGGEPVDQPGEERGENPAVEAGGGAINYTGPATADGVDYHALAALSTQAAKDSFSKGGLDWQLGSGTALVYEDAAEKLGLTLQLDEKGETLGVDIWNDAAIDGVQTGMTREQFDKALGQQGEEIQEIMGEARMVSISQSNRFHGRMTNLSPDSPMTLVTYRTDSGILQAVFVKGIDECLLLEVGR